MTDCVLFNEGLPLNLPSQAIAPVTFTGGPTFAQTARGPALYCTGGSTFSIAYHANIVAADLTIRVSFVPVSIGGTYTALLSNTSGGVREFGIYLNTSNQIQYVQLGNTSHDNFAIGSFPLGVYADVVLTRDAGGNTTVYQNGAVIGTDAGLTGTTTQVFPIVVTDAGNTNADNKYVAVQVWNRALTSGEILQLYNEPECFLTPADKFAPLFVGPAVVADTLIGQAIF